MMGALVRARSIVELGGVGIFEWRERRIGLLCVTYRTG